MSLCSISYVLIIHGQHAQSVVASVHTKMHDHYSDLAKAAPLLPIFCSVAVETLQSARPLSSSQLHSLEAGGGHQSDGCAALILIRTTPQQHPPSRTLQILRQLALGLTPDYLQ